MSDKNIKIEKHNHYELNTEVTISCYASTNLENAKEVMQDLEDFHEFINQKYNSNNITSKVFNKIKSFFEFKLRAKV